MRQQLFDLIRARKQKEIEQAVIRAKNKRSLLPKRTERLDYYLLMVLLLIIIMIIGFLILT